MTESTSSTPRGNTWQPGAAGAKGTASSAGLREWRWTGKGTSTSPTGATKGYRCSARMEVSLAKLRGESGVSKWGQDYFISQPG